MFSNYKSRSKIVCYISVLFLLMLCFGSPVIAAEPQDVSSLFYLQGKMPSILPFLLVYMLAFLLIALFLANACFSWQKIKYSIELMEAFMVEKLYHADKISPISHVAYREFKSGLLEEELTLGDKTVSHRGVYLLECNPPERIDIVSLHLMENIAQKWNRPLLYLGRNQQGILEGIMKNDEVQDMELSRFERYLSPFLFLLPALHPDPEIILEAAKKLKQHSSLGAVIIEDLNSNIDIRKYLQKSELNKFIGISKELRLPVFILFPGGGSCKISDAAYQEEKESALFSVGEIKMEKGNEIYTI